MCWKFKCILALIAMTLVWSSCGTSRVSMDDSTKVSPSHQVVQTAKSYVGSNYKYGASGPRKFDCSGFVYFVFSNNNIPIGRTTTEQSQAGQKISINRARPGDLVFFGKGRKMQHVGLVVAVGNGKLEIVHSTTSRGVVVEEVYSSPYWSNRLKFAVRVST